MKVSFSGAIDKIKILLVLTQKEKKMIIIIILPNIIHVVLPSEGGKGGKLRETRALAYQITQQWQDDS